MVWWGPASSSTPTYWRRAGGGRGHVDRRRRKCLPRLRLVAGVRRSGCSSAPGAGLGSNLELKPRLSHDGSVPVGGPGGDVTALFSRPLLTRRPGLPRTRSGPPVGDACLQAVANGPPARGLDKIGVAPRASGSRPGPGAIRPHLPPHGGEGVGVCPRGTPRLRGRVGLRLDHWPPLDPALPPERA